MVPCIILVGKAICLLNDAQILALYPVLAQCKLFSLLCIFVCMKTDLVWRCSVLCWCICIISAHPIRSQKYFQKAPSMETSTPWKISHIMGTFCSKLAGGSSIQILFDYQAFADYYDYIYYYYYVQSHLVSQ